MKISKRLSFLLLTLLFLFVISIAVYAVNSVAEGWAKSPGTSFIDYIGGRAQVTNSKGYTIFIPTKTTGEWQAFKASGLSGTSVCDPTTNGDWTNFGDYGECGGGSPYPGTCGLLTVAGTKTRYRSCSNPSPACGGAVCTGGSSDSVSCTYDVTVGCPVDQYCGFKEACLDCPSTSDLSCGDVHEECDVTGSHCDSGTCLYCGNPTGCGTYGGQPYGWSCV